MDKIVLQVNDIFSQAWRGCQKPMWFKVLNIDRTNNSIEVECHSFDGLKKPYNPYPEHGYKGIIAGNLLMPIRIDNPYYVATFVIPKGSQYAVNWKGEIVSNQIIYTGKHLKL